MNRKIVIIIVVSVMVALIVGFTAGFFLGDRIYTWFFSPFHDDLSVFWSAVVGIGTLALAYVAIRHSGNANKMNKRLLDMEEDANKKDFTFLSIVDVELTQYIVTQFSIRNTEKPLTYTDYKKIVSDGIDRIDMILWQAQNPDVGCYVGTIDYTNKITCCYEYNFSIDFFAKSSREFLIRDIEISGIAVFFRHHEGFCKAVWSCNEHDGKAKKVTLTKMFGVKNDSNHSFRLNFKVFSTHNELYGLNVGNNKVRIAFDKIRYTNILGITTECSQIIDADFDQDLLDTPRIMPFSFSQELHCSVENITIADMEGVK